MQLDISVMETLKALIGVPALLALIINILKKLGVVGKGEAPKWSKVLNTIIYAAFFVLATWFPNVDILFFDEIAQTVTNFGLALIGFVPAGVWVSGKVHDGIKGVPILGKTLS